MLSTNTAVGAVPTYTASSGKYYKWNEVWHKYKTPRVGTAWRWQKRWNNFGARDPARQFASPYVGMGNEPVSGVDPDGRYSKFGASYRRFTALLLGYNPSKIYKSGEEWGYNLEVQNGAGAIFVYGKTESEFLNNNDNYHYWWRKFIPDVYYVEVGFDLTFIGGGGAEFGLALPTRGANAGTLYGYRTFKFDVGLHGGAGLDFGRGDFSGEVEDFNFEEYFNGRSGKLEGDYIIGLAIEQSDRIHGNILTLTGLGVGPGIGGASGVGNTAATPFIGLW